MSVPLNEEMNDERLYEWMDKWHANAAAFNVLHPILVSTLGPPLQTEFNTLLHGAMSIVVQFQKSEVTKSKVT
jgi:hypothetical protein